MRLDKILCDASVGSRKDCFKLIRRGLVNVDGLVVKEADAKISDNAVIAVDGQVIERLRRVVCIMHKTAGLVTSTEDDKNLTVMTKLPPAMLKQGVVPVGRLDKDTEGLLVFTNDGDLVHALITPKYEIPKVYYVEHERDVNQQDIDRAAQGLVLKDGTVCKSAILKRVAEGKRIIQIKEGMYHQVKRMYGCLELGLTYLKRIQIGGLCLGDLPPDGVREITEEEIESLMDKDSSILDLNKRL